MDSRMLRLAVLTVDISRHRMTGPLPRTVVHRVAPQPAVFVFPSPGSSTGNVVSSANTLGEDSTVLSISSCNGASHQQARPTRLPSVERSSVTPSRAKIWDWRYSGRWSLYLLTRTWANSASVAMPPSIRPRSGLMPRQGG